MQTPGLNPEPSPRVASGLACHTDARRDPTRAVRSRASRVVSSAFAWTLFFPGPPIHVRSDLCTREPLHRQQ